jgi:hypothetical protein
MLVVQKVVLKVVILTDCGSGGGVKDLVLMNIGVVIVKGVEIGIAMEVIIVVTVVIVIVIVVVMSHMCKCID